VRPEADLAAVRETSGWVLGVGGLMYCTAAGPPGVSPHCGWRGCTCPALSYTAAHDKLTDGQVTERQLPATCTGTAQH